MPIPSKPQPPNRARTSEGAVRATGAADAEATAAVGPADGHAAAVDAWTAGRVAGTGNERVLQTFETAFAVVWRRANQTLGDITLTAITERVLYHSAALHPLLVGVHVDASGLRTDDLRTRVAAVPRAELVAAVRFVLVELLTVVGDLTGEILSAALHDELSKVSP